MRDKRSEMVKMDGITVVMEVDMGSIVILYNYTKNVAQD